MDQTSVTRVGGAVKNRKVGITNINELYNSVREPRILNQKYFEQPMVDILDLLFQKSSGSVDFQPQCECGAFKSIVYEGMQCQFCGTVVSSNFAKTFQPDSWIGLEPWMPKVLHPRLYILLEKVCSKHIVNTKSSKAAGKKEKMSVISLILDPSAELPDDLAVGIHGQGLKYFNDHCDEIMRFLLLEHPKIVSKPKEAVALWKIYQREKERDNVLVDKLPILNQAFHPLHVRGKSKTLDKTADLIMPVIIDMTHTAYSSRRLVVDSKFLDRELFSIYKKYIAYLNSVMETKLADKQALIRRHIVAGRCFFTCRGVIAPLLDRCLADEVHLPWNIAMVLWQAEIINLLVNRKGYTPLQAELLWISHVNKYNETIDEIFKTLIEECVYPGLPLNLNRNPTLLRTNIRLVYVTVIKTDVRDKTINLSPVIYKGFNADNDGDEMNGFLIKEMGTVHFFKRIHPKEGILSEATLSVSDWVKPTIEAFVHSNMYLYYGQDDTNDCEITLPPQEEMNAFAESVLCRKHRLEKTI